MAVKTVQKLCKTCNAPRPFDKEGTRVSFHIFMSVISGGGWAVVIWLPLVLHNFFLKKYRCRACGAKQ